MKGLLIVGAGGHGKVVADAASLNGKWDHIAFLDDNLKGKVLGWSVVGRIEEAPLFLAEYLDLAVAIGNNQLRVRLLEQLSGEGFSLPVIRHPAAVVSKYTEIGAGSVIFANSVVNPGTKIGIGSIVNTGSTIDHDCVLGKGVHISPGANLAGEVKIGDYSWLGVGATVIQQVTIGSNVTVGASSVIINNITNNVSVVGVPGRVIKQNE